MPQHTSGSDRTAIPPAARDGGSVRPPAPSTLDELWRSYKETGDERLREQLILHYSPLVKYVAGRVSVESQSAAPITTFAPYRLWSRAAPCS